MSTFLVSQRNASNRTVTAAVMFVDRHGLLCFAAHLPETDAPMSLTHAFADWVSASCVSESAHEPH